MAVWNGTLPTITVGQPALATDIDTIVDALDALTGAWTTYTPTWTALGTAPSLGNGVLQGRYTQADRFATATGRLIPGSTTTFGTGGWRFNLPVSAESASFYAGVGVALDTSAAAAQTPLVARIAATSTIKFFSITGEVTATTPFTWANGDELIWSITYQAV